jgi:hypothetical protein
MPPAAPYGLRLKPLLPEWRHAWACCAFALLLGSVAAVAQDRSQRHGSHGGQHGGLLLPVAGDTLHLEGVFQEQRRFRVYVTDAAGRALAPSALRALDLKISDEAGRISPLVLAADGQYLEARIATQPMPAAITVIIDSSNGDAERWGMLFSAYTIEPPSFEVVPITIPPTLKGVLEALRGQVQASIELSSSRDYGQLYEPATHARELLLALVPYAEQLEAAPRLTAEAAIASALRASWLAHLSGDVGTPVQSSAAVEALRDAFDELSRTFPDLVTPFS